VRPASRQTSNAAVNEELIFAARVLASCGLVTGFGHVSVRTGPSSFLVTPPKPPGSLGRSDDPVEVSLESGTKPAGAPGEVWIHWAIYRSRPDVAAVCKAETEFAQALAIGGVPIRPVHGHGGLVGEEVPVHGNVELIRSPKLGEDVAERLGRANAVMLRGIGPVTVGTNLGEAVALMWALERSAKMIFLSRTVGEPILLTAQEISDWQAKRTEVLPRIWDYLRSQFD